MSATVVEYVSANVRGGSGFGEQRFALNGTMAWCHNKLCGWVAQFGVGHGGVLVVGGGRMDFSSIHLPLNQKCLPQISIGEFGRNLQSGPISNL